MNTGLSRKIQQKIIYRAGSKDEPGGVRDRDGALEVTELTDNHRVEDQIEEWEAEQPPYTHRDIF